MRNHLIRAEEQQSQPVIQTVPLLSMEVVPKEEVPPGLQPLTLSYQD